MANNVNSYKTKIVGTTFDNRQDTIALMPENSELRFRREPENEFDVNAVAVDALITKTKAGSNRKKPIWSPIGYISADKNKELADLLTNGKYASIKLLGVTGGGKKSFGVNVYIEHERERVEKTVVPPTAKLEKDIFGNEIFYDDASHTYMSATGEVYLSGSKYADQFEKAFDSDMFAAIMVKNSGLKDKSRAKEAEAKLKALWELNAEASRSYGTAIHAAVEMWGSYKAIADLVDHDKDGNRKIDSKTKNPKYSFLSKLPHLADAAKAFFDPESGRGKYPTMYEVLVVDHVNRRAGRIDELTQLDADTYMIGDQKTNAVIGAKEKSTYQKQLSFYGDIIIANGKKVHPKLVLHHWTSNEWVDIYLDKINTLEVSNEDRG